MTEPARLSTGCDPVNELLGGGIEVGAITQVYGPPASGKTNLALSTAVSVASDGGRVLYIDAEGISPARLEQLVAGQAGEADADAITDRIAVREVHDFDEQRDAVRDAAEVGPEVELIVIDSLTGYYRLERAEDEREGDALRDVTRQVTHLLSVARKHDLAILVTNQVFMDPEAERVRPLGGNTLGHWSHAVIRLDRFRGGNRRATLEQHRSRPTGETAVFRITADRLVPADGLGG